MNTQTKNNLTLTSSTNPPYIIKLYKKSESEITTNYKEKYLECNNDSITLITISKDNKKSTKIIPDKEAYEICCKYNANENDPIYELHDHYFKRNICNHCNKKISDHKGYINVNLTKNWFEKINICFECNDHYNKELTEDIYNFYVTSEFFLEVKNQYDTVKLKKQGFTSLSEQLESIYYEPMLNLTFHTHEQNILNEFLPKVKKNLSKKYLFKIQTKTIKELNYIIVSIKFKGFAKIQNQHHYKLFKREQ